MNTKSKILYFVPTKNRAKVFYDNTFVWLETLRQYFDFDYRVLVEPQDLEQYTELVGAEKDDDLFIVLEENDRGLGYSLETAKKYAEDNGYDAIWKIDDDIKSFCPDKYKEPKNWDLEARAKSRAENFLETIKIVEQILEKQPRVGAIGFPYSFQIWQAGKSLDINKKLQTSYVVRTKLYQPDAKISTQEDYWAYINVRMSGYSTIRCNLYGIDLGVDVGGGTGGLQDFDRSAMSEKEKEIIQKKYPNVVFKKKEGKSWGWEVDFRKTKFERI